MIKYCFLVGCFRRDDPLIFERQGLSLANNGFDVTIVICDKSTDEIVNGVKIASCHFVPRTRLQRYTIVRKLLLKKALEINADIYQLSEPFLFPLASILKKKYNKKVVFNMREAYLNVYKTSNGGLLSINARHVLASLFFKKYLPVFDVIILSTDGIKNDLRHIRTKRIEVIYNFPVVDKDFSLSEKEYLSRSDEVCYEGTVYKISRQETFFSALSKMPNVKYHIAGVIEYGYRKFIMANPYWKCVEFSGRFRKDELPKIFSSATISNVIRDTSCSVMSGSYGILKLFESMEYGLPILCERNDINEKITTEYHCGICVNPNDVNEIHSAIKYLVENKNESYKMGQNGRRAVLEKFNWEIMEGKYIEIINSL